MEFRRVASRSYIFARAVHFAPHGLIDVKALDCDFLVCSPYKFFGPHMGTLYGKREHLQRFKPYKVRPAADAIPDCWETGTQAQELNLCKCSLFPYNVPMCGPKNLNVVREERAFAEIQAVQGAPRGRCHSRLLGNRDARISANALSSR